jgi:FKBP-type peptidyl-prolyl cis-trans isomerase FkpA/FKBP-type peptidyl-prolyl cis-trans isomerase FklB
MRLFITRIAIPLLVTCVVFPASAQEEKKLETTADELSYALGMDVGNSLKRLDVEVDFDIFTKAVEATMEGGETLLTPQQAREVTKNFVLEKRKKQLAERKEAAKKNLAEGEAFLAENKAKEGVITTDSGLQYQVIKKGDGEKPKATDTVTVQYRGTLLDGTEFDSSYARGKPATFRVGGVIPGWTEALQMMPVGSTYKLFIPPKLAYGERGSGGKIGPNSTLIFEVELLEIAAAEPEKAAATPHVEPAEKKGGAEAAGDK